MNAQLLAPHVDSHPEKCGGKPCVAGTRIRVYDVYCWYELQRQRADEILFNFPQLTMGDVYGALAYFWDHREEILEQIEVDDRLVREFIQKQAQVPTNETAVSSG